MKTVSTRHLVELDGVVFSSHALSQTHQVLYVSLEGKRSPVLKKLKESFLSVECGMQIFSIKASPVKFKNE